MDRRIGRFAIRRELVERDPETARAIMGRCIVVRCEMMYSHDTLEYMALSPDFDEVPQGAIAPEYDVIISDGGKIIEFKRSNAEVRGAATRGATMMTEETDGGRVDRIVRRLRAENERLRALLREAYGYTTDAKDLLPERIKAALTPNVELSGAPLAGRPTQTQG